LDVGIIWISSVDMAIGGINMPDVRNCRRCGKIYSYIGGVPLCNECKRQDEEDFKRVKEYLYDHPKATIYEVSNELDISVQRIKNYLKQGRLEIIGDEGNLILECELCGKSIKTGRFCEECTNSLSRDIKSTVDEIKKPIYDNSGRKLHGGMRYLHKGDK
jgi:flagellar operon protein (TIGR03826 family)